jgi:hypothetical protein
MVNITRALVLLDNTIRRVQMDGDLTEHERDRIVDMLLDVRNSLVSTEREATTETRTA